jgi:hypothetical protein
MNWREYLRDNVWAWAGAAFLLVTLTGSTLLWATMITAVTVLLHYLMTKGDD